MAPKTKTKKKSAKTSAVSKESKLWAGRFTQGVDPDMEKMSVSLPYDQKLYPEDIAGSLAQADALFEAGILKKSELLSIQKGLMNIRQKLDNGVELFQSGDEDIHMAIERILTEIIGDAGKKLHTGRSRNDQIATDFRLYIKRRSAALESLIQKLQLSLFHKALDFKTQIMPGYTHLQQAQPILISHYLLSFFWALERDKSRLRHTAEMSNTLPLGSGALAGSAFPYNRMELAKSLGFKKITENSVDAVSHRDFALEFLNAIAILGSLLSRYAEDFVIWSSSEFGFIELGEPFTTGSSMMPQKKNPDSMELIRGKAGRLLGNYVTLFTAIKGTPLSYSRDLQEDKEPVFDSVDTITLCLRVMAKAIESMMFNTAAIQSKMIPEMLATDLADQLVKDGVPFREAHHRVGELVKAAESSGIGFLELPDTLWENIPIDINLKNKLSYKASTDSRNIPGGTGSKSVSQQLQKARRILKKTGLIK